jgi:phosphopantetheine--protein transferase-like protein
MEIIGYSKSFVHKAPNYLVKSELSYFKKLRKHNINRSLEWLAGRIVAKKVIRKYLTRQKVFAKFKDIEIIKDVGGKTGFILRDRKQRVRGNEFSLSISHTDQFAAADIAWIAKEGSVGIDVESIRKFKPLVYQSFLTKKERKWLAALGGSRSARYATLIWSIKEAYLKAMGTGIRVHPATLEVIKPSKAKEFALIVGGRKVKCSLWYKFFNHNHVAVKVVM